MSSLITNYRKSSKNFTAVCNDILTRHRNQFFKSKVKAKHKSKILWIKIYLFQKIVLCMNSLITYYRKCSNNFTADCNDIQFQI